MLEQFPNPASSSDELARLRNEVSELRKTNALLLTEVISGQESQRQFRKDLQEVTQLKDVLEQNAFLIITDATGRMIYVNEPFCTLSGYEREELLGQSASVVNSHCHSSEFWAKLWDTITSGNVWQGQIKNQAKDGRYFWVDMVITPVLDEQGKPYQYVALRRDSTEQKQAEDLLRFHAYILSHINEAVIGLDNQSRITYWNRGAEKQYGFCAHEVIGKPLADAFYSQSIDPTDEARAMRELAETGVCRTEIIHRLKNGKELYVETITEVLFNEAGEKEGLLVVIHDITGRVQVQQTLSDTLTELRQRNDELDQYVYKVSHDLRAPLSSILGLIPLIGQEDNPQVKEHYIHLIDNRARKLDGYIQSVLTQSQVLNVQLRLSPLSLESLIRECFEELRYHKNWDKIELIIEQIGEASFYSDELRMTAILKNVISNTIRYANTHTTASYLAFRIAVTPKETNITVSDNGIGIAPEYLPKIFDMFFRGTATSDGAGLGLYIAKQAVEKLNGQVTVESEVGTGTIFRFTFPNASPDIRPTQ